MDAEVPPFVPRAPWWGADLQTLRNTLAARRPRLDRWPALRLRLAMADGSDDRLAALIQVPNPSDDAGRPTVALVHGLGGDETSAYMVASAAYWLGRGHPVLRINLRGSGPSRPTCRFQYHAGRSGDLRDALASFAAQRPRLVERGLVLIGFSLGGNLVLKLMGELAAVDSAGVEILAAASISAPIDLESAAHRFRAPRNRVYQWHMLRNLKREAMAPGAEVSAAERRAITAARSLWEFDERFVAPRGGFADVRDYYAKSSSIHLLDSIRVPSLAIHAVDDPWIPAGSYTGRHWREDAAVRPLLVRGGGHVGFHAAGARSAWHDRCIAAFLDSLGATA